MTLDRRQAPAWNTSSYLLLPNRSLSGERRCPRVGYRGVGRRAQVAVQTDESVCGKRGRSRHVCFPLPSSARKEKGSRLLSRLPVGETEDTRTRTSTGVSLSLSPPELTMIRFQSGL